MSWHEDLRSVDLNGRAYKVLDKIKEEGQTYLGLAPFDAVAEVAAAMDAGRPRPMPAHLTWVEESDSGFLLLSKKDVDRLLKRKSDRALAAFKKK